jgi:hypothetical protein
MPRKIKRGDRTPALVMDVALPDADLSTVASWLIIIKKGTAIVTSVAPTVDVGDDTSTAVITHDLTVDDTATLGRYLVEVEATWPDATTTTFPSSSVVVYDVVADLNPPA